MKWTTALLAISVLYVLASADDGHPPVARYDYYQLVRLHIDTDEQLGILKELEARHQGIEFYGHVRTTNQSLTILVPARLAVDISTLFLRYDIAFKVLLPNIQDNIDRQLATVKPKGTPGKEMDWHHYYHLDTIEDYLQYLSETYDSVTLMDIGKSYEGRPIKGIRISKKTGNTGIFIEGGIHAREWISPATSTYIINQLLTSTDPRVQDLSSKFDFYFFPVVNPDGFEYTFQDRLWRKNRKPYGVCVGVDLNRNFASNWNGTGSSGDPCQFDFSGSASESEEEVQVLSKLLRDHHKEWRIKTFISLHSFSQLIMFPYGHTRVKVENYEDLKAITGRAVDAIRAKHGAEYMAGSVIETIYPSSGGSTDWAMHELGIKLSLIIELRGPPDSVDMFILPADQIIPVGEEMVEAFLAITQEAGKRGYFE